MLRTLGFREEETRSTASGRSRHEIEFQSPEKVRVKLHWQASSRFATTLDAEPFLERSVLHRMRDGRPVRILEPADELLYLAVHAARHRLTRLRWLWEIGALLERRGAEELERFVERAGEASVTRPVAVTLGVLHERLECERAGECSRRLPRGLLLRGELAITGVIPGAAYRQPGLLSRGLFAASEHTYRALLAEKPKAALSRWASSIGRSFGNLFRRA